MVLGLEVKVWLPHACLSAAASLGPGRMHVMLLVYWHAAQQRLYVQRRHCTRAWLHLQVTCHLWGLSLLVLHDGQRKSNCTYWRNGHVGAASDGGCSSSHVMQVKKCRHERTPEQSTLIVCGHGLVEGATGISSLT